MRQRESGRDGEHESDSALTVAGPEDGEGSGVGPVQLLEAEKSPCGYPESKKEPQSYGCKKLTQCYKMINGCCFSC